MSEHLLYLAYGSNLHPLRLAERVGAARFRGHVCLEGFALRFHKRSDVDGSGKADAYRTEDSADRVWTAAWALTAAEKSVLDRYEGLGVGYDIALVRVPVEGRLREAFLYVARSGSIEPELRPFPWYRDLIVAGLQYHRAPAPYTAAVERQPAVPDLLGERRARMQALLQRIHSQPAGTDAGGTTPPSSSTPFPARSGTSHRPRS